ncbi:hypothetical protein EYF80_014796 [Liparis tanakae]|uniref:Uncharacterized protein n=1 Tax=Liparis tanakae TaxID=230148 RepID=A0A4Z2IAZ0_9TELE|nr:hypothetical protein EYF80_014796 [Liparis tanakae]
MERSRGHQAEGGNGAGKGRRKDPGGMEETRSAPHPLTYITSQVGALIHYCLDPQESPPPVDSGRKLAERGLIQDQSSLDQEDCMCLRYLSFTDLEAVVSATGQLGLALKTESPCVN